MVRFRFYNPKIEKQNRTQTEKNGKKPSQQEKTEPNQKNLDKPEKNEPKPSQTKKTEPNRFEPIFILKNRTKTGRFEPVSVWFCFF